MDYITFRQPSDDPEATLLALDGLDTTALLRLASNRPSRSELDLAIEGRLRDALDAMAET